MFRQFEVIRWGVTEEMDHDFRRVTMLSNVIYLMVMSIVALYVTINISFYLNVTGKESITIWVPFWLMGISAVSLLLNRARWYLSSKLLMMFSWVYFTCFLGPITGIVVETTYITFGMYAVVSSVMVHILFSWRRERVTYIIVSAVTWGIIFFFVELLDYFRSPDLEFILFKDGFARWRLLIIMLALFFDGAIVYIIRVNHQLNAALVLRNELIEQQNQQLAAQREKLVALAMQLREKVDTTHDQLTEQNQRLTEYSYFNSHILRAPVSRIRGLLHLLSLKIDPREEAEVRTLLENSMKELDMAIHEITERLNTEPE